MSAQSLPVLRLGNRLITYSLDPSEVIEDDHGGYRPMILVHEINGEKASQELVDELLRRPTFERRVWQQYAALQIGQVQEYSLPIYRRYPRHIN